MKAMLYNQEFSGKWNDFLKRSRNATFLFHRNFMEYHASRFKDYSLIITDEEENILALLPANITDEKTVSSHEGLTYGGLVVHKEETLLNILSYFREALAFLNERGISRLLYKEMPYFYQEVPGEEHQYALFLLQATLFRRDTAITICNRHPLPFQERRKREYKKGLKSGIEIKEVNHFDDFWNMILIPNLKNRYGLKPVHSMEEISLLKSCFPDNIRQFNAYCKGKVMAGATIFETPLVAHAQYIGVSEEGRKNGSLDLLFHHLIRETYSRKEYFSFGTCNEENGQKINQGLLEWKEGFGGRTYVHNFYEIHTGNHIRLNNIVRS